MAQKGWFFEATCAHSSFDAGNQELAHIGASVQQRGTQTSEKWRKKTGVNAWNEQTKKFYDSISDEKSFYLEGGNVRPVKNRQWNATGHEFELTLNSVSRIEPCDDSNNTDDKLNLTVVPLAQIDEHYNKCIDILAIVDRSEQSSAIKLKSNFTHRDMRQIYLSDPTASLIKLTLWGKDAMEFNPSNVHKVVAIKGVLVKEHDNEFFLSTISGTTFKYEPEGPAADILQIWAYNDRPSLEIESFCTSFGKDAYSLDSPDRKPKAPSKFGQYHSQCAHQQHLNRTLADLTQDYARLNPRHTLQSLTICDQYTLNDRRAQRKSCGNSKCTVHVLKRCQYSQLGEIKLEPELLAKLKQFQPSESCPVFTGCKEVFGSLK
uniref:Replication protein A OB domain-containing protein n=1 Tax=Ditylenchus dipsaci TaxID=166011 RepID=A0A915EFK4_9BILA